METELQLLGSHQRFWQELHSLPPSENFVSTIKFRSKFFTNYLVDLCFLWTPKWNYSPYNHHSSCFNCHILTYHVLNLQLLTFVFSIRHNFQPIFECDCFFLIVCAVYYMVSIIYILTNKGVIYRYNKWNTIGRQVLQKLICRSHTEFPKLQRN